MFLIIGIWGGPRRVYAAFKFFLYTLTGSVLMLLAIMTMCWTAGTTDITVLLHHAVPAWHAEVAVAGFLRFIRGEDTDVAGPHLAAGCARRSAHRGLGHFGRRAAEDGRIRVPAFLAADVPDGFALFAPLISRSRSLPSIYTSMVALAQTDMKKLIAYSSIAHMGVVTLGIVHVQPAGP